MKWNGFLVGLGVASSLCFALPVFAQDQTPQNGAGLQDGCYNIDTPEWTDGFNQLSANYKAKNYEEALKEANKLNAICERSPILNFAIGRIYREMGNDDKGLYYMQRATFFSEEFRVNSDTLERMWYERYELEHVNAREETINARNKQIEDQQAEIETLKADIQALDDEMKALKAQTTLDWNTHVLEERSHYAAGMWSGVAMGGLGIILAITGGVLMQNQKDDAVKFSDEERKAWPKDSTYLYTGILGGGIALVAAGAVIAGIMGYHYAHTPIPDAELDLAIGPTGASVSLNF